MKTKLTKLAIVALLASSSSIAISNLARADQRGSAVGDLPGYGEDAYFGEDAAYTESQDYEPSYEKDSSYDDEGDYAYEDQGVRPVGHLHRSVMQPVSHEVSGSGCGCGDGGCSDGGCSNGGCGDVSYGGYQGTSCGGCVDTDCGSCNSCESRPRPRLGRRHARRMDSRNRRSGWGSMEVLGWWTQNQDSPPLILRSDPGTLSVLDEPSAISVFGDDLNGEISGGTRSDVGLWLSDNIGIGGRLWMLAENNDSYFFTGTGADQSIGRSFYNTDSQNFVGFSGGEDSLLVAYEGPFGTDVSGSIAANSSLDLWAAEAYARLRFGCTNSCRLDFIGGYSHFDIENKLSINSTSVILEGAFAGNYLQYGDNFRTENEFNGGQLGFEMVMNRGRWTARSLTKVHLGNMTQSASAWGTFATGVVGSAPGTTLGEGVLVGTGNRSWSRDVFSFIPEANFKLGYQISCRANLTVGYSFLYFDNVALNGDIIDRMVDGSALGTGGVNTNGILTDDSSLWVHGIDLGLTFTF